MRCGRGHRSTTRPPGSAGGSARRKPSGIRRRPSSARASPSEARARVCVLCAQPGEYQARGLRGRGVPEVTSVGVRQRLLAAVAIALVASPLRASRPDAGRAPSCRCSGDRPRLASSLDLAFGSRSARVRRRRPGVCGALERARAVPAEQAKTLRGLGAALFEQNRRVEAAGCLARALDAATAVGDRSEQGWARRYHRRPEVRRGARPTRRARCGTPRGKTSWHRATRAASSRRSTTGAARAGPGAAPLVERGYAIALAMRDPLLEGQRAPTLGAGAAHAALPGPALVELERAVALMRPLDPDTRAYLTDALAVLGWALRAHGAPIARCRCIARPSAWPGRPAIATRRCGTTTAWALR